MIVLDIETSGVDFIKCGIWQIGAIDLETGEEFLEEARIDDEDEILDVEGKIPVLEIIGKTEEELRDKNKQSQKELLDSFLKWVETRKIRNFICHNPWFDVGFINTKREKYGLKSVADIKCLDLHSVAQMKFFDINNKFLVDFEKRRSNFNLTNVIEFCGLKDERGAHNALEDAKLTAECFSRLVYGKGLFPEFSKFEIPNYLKK